MRIAEVCSRRVVCVDPKASAKDAAEAMHHQDVGALVVVRADKRKPAGILTDRDLVTRVMAPGMDPRAVPVAEVMTRTLATCRGDHELLDVLGMMGERGIRRVPVVDVKGDLIGIVTTDDLIGALAEHVLTLARSVLGAEVLEQRRYGNPRAPARAKRAARR